jgi:hypothetical protein
MANGLVVVIDYVIHAGSSGTLIVQSAVADKPETQSERLVMQEVLRSVRLQTPSVEPDDEPQAPKPRASKKRKRPSKRATKRAE